MGGIPFQHKTKTTPSNTAEKVPAANKGKRKEVAFSDEKHLAVGERHEDANSKVAKNLQSQTWEAWEANALAPSAYKKRKTLDELIALKREKEQQQQLVK